MPPRMDHNKMSLDEIREKVVKCTDCDLCKTRTNAVPGKGNGNADIIFVGEAPGKNEDMRGEPFVGAAGKKLSEALAHAGVSRDDIYITNVVKCRPPKNRIPAQNERMSCIGYLKDEIRMINPRIICVMGNTAFGSLLDGADIMKFRGNIFSRDKDLYFISIHPAATIYNPSLEDVLKKDMASLVKITGRLKNKESVTIDHEYTA